VLAASPSGTAAAATATPHHNATPQRAHARTHTAPAPPCTCAASIPDEFFSSAPALERFVIHKNMLKTVPATICGCKALTSIQLQVCARSPARAGRRAHPPACGPRRGTPSRA